MAIYIPMYPDTTEVKAPMIKAMVVYNWKDLSSLPKMSTAKRTIMANIPINTARY